jgi:hypothetical protein
MRINSNQMTALDEQHEKSRDARVKLRLIEEHSDILSAQTDDAVNAVLEQLKTVGFSNYQHLYGAATILFSVGKRTDDGAEDARAVVEAALGWTEQSPDARLEFLRNQKLDKPSA